MMEIDFLAIPSGVIKRGLLENPAKIIELNMGGFPASHV
jgi:hypothetical protein